MFTKQDLMESFAVVDEGSGGHYFFQHKLPKVTYNYCLKSSSDRDVLNVSEDVDDREFAAEVLDQAPSLLSPSKPNIYKLAGNEYGFTHAIAVPCTYHASLKGRLEPKRGKLFLCVPIYRSEFSGDETESEFKEMMTRMIPVFRWKRSACPKLKVYFDNPKTGSGTYENGALLKFPTFISEVENLNGVVNGFIEVTNYKGEVLEVLSPRKDVYTLIRNRTDEDSMDLPKLLQKLSEFAEG
ncbi:MULTISPECIES: hypothetical protein [Pseudomonas]|uniref:hypothetical protein n=1 Tax=Pseudomonas TaxID=286 RepID=UPI001AE85114|nr:MULTISPECIES: hypothetical protein [unclassified Pseudomonas]MBP1127128.1 hypothetical protein [Pseudomonas sp. PvP025]MDQ0400988.1 hypothetical protein [Pseudomonas sp. PvP006]